MINIKSKLKHPPRDYILGHNGLGIGPAVVAGEDVVGRDVAVLLSEHGADDASVWVAAALRIHEELGVHHVPGHTAAGFRLVLLVRHPRVVDTDLVAARHRRGATCELWYC